MSATVVSDAHATAAPTSDATRSEWWRTAVIYQIYPRSFADASGDGIGDLAGITARLDSLAALGVDAIWLSPFYTSPQKDAGYDVADFTDVDPLFGTIEDFDAMTARAHELGLRVIVDIVPNHTSDAHAWFQAARASAPGSLERDRYVFRDGRGAGGDEPPNNWQSIFGGPAWTRLTEPDGTPGQWYLHLFDTSQPDLNWANDEVLVEFDRVLRFWLDRGVDGFRVDVAHGLIKAEGLPDFIAEDDGDSMGGGAGPIPPWWAQDGVHAIWRRWRRVVDAYPGERILAAEAWVSPLSLMARWVRPDEMHQAFNFSYLSTDWHAADLRAVIDESIAEFGAVGAPSTWVLSNHDVVRHASRMALSAENPQGHGIGPRSAGLPDPVVGLQRGRAATLLMLALPGSAYIYQGEELGLPEAIHIPDEARQDPTWHRTEGERYGRDGCRVPLPWEADAPAHGFSPTGHTWLPQPEEWARFARDAQEGVATSTLTMYSEALRLRRGHGLAAAELTWLETPEGVLGLRVGDITVLANVDGADFPLPSGEVIVASAPVTDSIPADTCVWMVL
ncbi:glycoside hydrolase family 13 protein [Demequina sp. NBRC 110056]|uniref:glycoside hydrolase family 13 protein n=1 Tax=Demequina sp. NBRC 110056 TaxID=1570345 RepID=UPI000A07928D|nr:glycoside hydrolase family 13 protein [Demequina sp. NBRC 110056]